MSVFSLFATCPKAVEDLLAVELGTLGAAGIRQNPGVVAFSATLETAYRVCLWSRVANRVLLPLASFSVTSPQELIERVREIAWEEHLSPRETIAVDCTLSGPPARLPPSLANARYAALVAKDGIADFFSSRYGKRPDVRPDRPDLQINLHIHAEEATIAVDLTGESLHRRSYRARGVEAPLKENVAAAMLLRAHWPEIARAGGPLIDPMCGSGTLLIEGAMIAGDIAPGIRRPYWGFLRWHGHDEAMWKSLVREAKERAAAGAPRLPLILGFDRDSAAVAAARTNVETAGLAGRVRIERRELAEAASPIGSTSTSGSGARPEPAESPADAGRKAGTSPDVPPLGLVAANPPYGERLGEVAALHGLYQELGRILHERFAGFRAAILTGHEELARSVGLRAAKINTLYNGPIRSTLAIFELTVNNRFVTREPPPPEEEGGSRSPGAFLAGGQRRSGTNLTRSPQGSGTPLARGAGARELESARLTLAPVLKPQPQEATLAPTGPPQIDDVNIAMFVNRIVKNHRLLSKWARREAVSCYRLYDADLPEYAVAVDFFEERWLHVQEYVAPAYIDPEKTERRLSAVIAALPGAMGIDPASIFLKKRRRRKPSEQYTRMDSKGEFYEVHEGGLRYLVNFTDYLDTGLFLDHRITRGMIREAAKGRHFLNLYAYTCTATVCAAAGGSLSTTSVDSSNTYLRWARENLTLNGIAGQEHTLQRADCTEWLRTDRRRYGLIFMDPPTYSNSKDKRPTFDVQRDHVKIVRLAAERLEPDGLLLFSTNFRRFAIDLDGLSGLAVEDISAATIPTDFARNRRIHHCYRIKWRT